MTQADIYMTDDNIETVDTHDLLVAALEEKPLEFAKAFDGAMAARIAELVDAKKQELSQSFLGASPAPPDEPEEGDSEEENGDEELGDGEEEENGDDDSSEESDPGDKEAA